MKQNLIAKTWIEISRKNLLHNLGEFKKHANGARIMAVIKANAYGHGLKEVASILKTMPGVMLGVDSLEEALIARSSAPKNEIMILGYIPKKDIRNAIAKEFHISIYDRETADWVSRLVKNHAVNPRKLHAHIKVETGTNRLGLRPEEISRLNLPKLEGIYTHLAESEDLKSNFYKKQLAALEKIKKLLVSKGLAPKFTHTSCTAAIIQHGALGGNLVRLGLGLYGLWPTEKLKNKFSGKLRLRPVLAWKTRLAQVKKVTAGETVGYDRTHKTKYASTIGILPVGYYDGYDRKLSGRGEVLVKGSGSTSSPYKRAKVAGRICMNMTMVDLGNISPWRESEVVLIGRQRKEKISVDDIAEKIGTINYEVVARINPLIKRVIK